MKTNELKCTDLRIGNYLKYDDEIIQVSVLRKNYVEFYDKEDLLIGDNPNEFQPIELTEEVLLKIGFKEYCDDRFEMTRVIQNLHWYISYQQGSLVIGGYQENYRMVSKLQTNIKYLHELQNAYYCLTGQELEVEL